MVGLVQENDELKNTIIELIDCIVILTAFDIFREN